MIVDVSQVRTKKKTGDAFPQQLVLVQDRPRFFGWACSLVIAFTTPPPLPTEPGSGSGSGTLVTTLARKFCSANEPFPGKVVSRPCDQRKLEVQPEGKGKGWFSNALQTSLSRLGFDGSWKSGGGVCSCKPPGGGGEGPCTIRASPGRNPCVYIEVGAKKGGGVGTGRIESAESVNVSSAIELKTRCYGLPMPSLTTSRAGDGMGGIDGTGGEGTAPDLETALVNALAALQAAAVERGLPETIPVPVYVVMLLAGAVLMFVARPLSEWRMFHYLLSIVLGSVFGAGAIVLPAVKNPRRTFFR